jgi:tetratricopeptide (TPR) repeat protein
MKALEIDSNLAEAHTSLAFAAGGFAWDWATAEREYKRAIELNPNYATTHHWFEKAEQLVPSLEIESQIAYVQALSGNKRAAQKTLNELTERSNHSYVSDYHLAVISLALDDKDQALHWLEKACDKHGVGMGTLKVDPMIDSLRSDPRFTDLMRRVGLPQ